MLLSTALIIMNRAWHLTSVSIAGIIVQPTLILIFVPYMSEMGPGGAGAGAAAGLMGMETFVTLIMFVLIGKRTFDSRNIYAIVASLGVGCAVIALDLLLLRPYGPWRLLIDVAVYAVLAIAVRAVRLGDGIAAVRLILARRRGE
jgi:O-antigen/teichoic acid export membrane protein